MTPELKPAAFWDSVRRRAGEALRSGALQPVSTRASFIQDHGVAFIVRVSDNLLRKQDAPSTYEAPRRDNPFLPPDPGLTIGCLPPHHVAVLNKFNVLDNHVLVITRGFVHQEAPLTAADFAAMTAGLAGGRALAFYNGGRTAGASQPHRHFQLVPLPLGRDRDIPTGVLLDGAADGINTVNGLRFRHAFRTLQAGTDDPESFSRDCFSAYLEALSALGLSPDPARDERSRLPPYNLLLTDRWLFMAPRSVEHCAGISVNGLGYAGSLFVSTPEKLEHVRATGPMTILEHVSIPLP